MDGTCDWPGCKKDATEEWLSGPNEGLEFCADHIDLEPTAPTDVDGDK